MRVTARPLRSSPRFRRDGSLRASPHILGAELRCACRRQPEERTKRMLTADDYRESIRDGRASYLEGQRVVDPVTHPLLRVSVDWVASTYERPHSAGPDARNPIFDQAATPAELDEQMNFLIEADFTAAVRPAVWRWSTWPSG